MNFIELKTLNSKVKSQLVDFFLKSKPFSFCESPSLKQREAKINEYIDFLFEESDVYILEEAGVVQFLIAISFESCSVEINFCFGKPFSIVKNFYNFRHFFYKKNPHTIKFWAEVTREFKKDKYLKSIKRRDKSAEIKIDKNRIFVYWYQ